MAKLSPIARGYQVIAHPDRLLPFHDVKYVRPSRAFPHPKVILARAGYHIGKATCAAPDAHGLLIAPNLIGHRIMVFPRFISVKDDFNAYFRLEKAHSL